MKKYCFYSFIILFSNHCLAFDGSGFSFWFSSNSPSRIEFPINNNISGIMEIENRQFNVYIQDNGSQKLTQIEDDLNGELNVQINDFNFDGNMDIAIMHSYGYAGVNIYSDIFFFDTDNVLFEKKMSASNVSADVDKKELLAAEKSGPHFYKTVYKFNNGEPYIYSESVNVSSDIEQVTLKNPAGDVVKKVLVDSYSEDNSMEPAIKAVSAERAYLYNGPDESTKTKMYLIAGDKVTLLDMEGDYYEGWILVRYKGKKTIEKWLKADQLQWE